MRENKWVISKHCLLRRQNLSNSGSESRGEVTEGNPGTVEGPMDQLAHPVPEGHVCLKKWGQGYRQSLKRRNARLGCLGVSLLMFACGCGHRLPSLFPSEGRMPKEPIEGWHSEPPFPQGVLIPSESPAPAFHHCAGSCVPPTPRQQCQGGLGQREAWGVSVSAEKQGESRRRL